MPVFRSGLTKRLNVSADQQKYSGLTVAPYAKRSNDAPWQMRNVVEYSRLMRLVLSRSLVELVAGHNFDSQERLRPSYSRTV